MGLLEEAIREHLELKRRSGADPGEVARQERDALGPAVRAAQEPETPDADAEAAGAVGAGEPGAIPEPAEPAATFVDPLELPTEPPVEPATSGLEESTLLSDDEIAELPEVDEEPPADLGAGTPSDSPGDDAPATLRDSALEPDEAAPPPLAEPAPGEEGDSEQSPPPEGEDVLEETPEFLQETPEHERLWFEQRPPRDFDFE